MSAIEIEPEAVKFDVICDTCKNSLAADYDYRKETLRVEPCENCLEKAKEEGR